MKKIYLLFRRILLFFVQPLMFRRQSTISLNNIKKILIIRTDRIGDLILSTPTFHALREKFTQANITLVINSINKDLSKNIPWVDRVVVYTNLFKTARILRQERFDLAIDLLMDYPVKSALLSYLSNARYRVGYDIQGRGIFFDMHLRPNNEEKHMIEKTLDIVRTIGVDIHDQYPDLILLEEDKRYIEEFLSQQDISRDDFLIGIHPGGHFPSQCWLPERFAELADRIIQRYSAKIIIVASLKERQLVNKIKNLMNRGKSSEAIGLPLNKISALIARCNLFICNNSGPLHIAVALGVPTVSTMGPTIPYLWWPQGDEHIVVRKDLPCSPCNYGICRNQQCMQLITVEDMLEAVEKQLGYRGV